MPVVLSISTPDRPRRRAHRPGLPCHPRSSHGPPRQGANSPASSSGHLPRRRAGARGPGDPVHPRRIPVPVMLPPLRTMHCSSNAPCPSSPLSRPVGAVAKDPVVERSERWTAPADLTSSSRGQGARQTIALRRSRACTEIGACAFVWWVPWTLPSGYVRCCTLGCNGVRTHARTLPLDRGRGCTPTVA